MDENQSTNQENQTPEPAPSSEPNVYEPQPRTQPPSFEQPTPKKSHKLALVIVMLVLLLIAGGAAAYLMSQEEDTVPVETSQTNEQTEQEAEEPAEETETEVTYQSELYPDLSFTIPDGWEVNEPETYDSEPGEGSADSTITVSNGDVMLSLDLVTVLATGFEGYRCYDRVGLTAVGDVYRFVDSEGVIVYADGISETDDEWANVIADEGEFTTFEDPDPNYCVSFPYIGTYSSTLNQVDYPDQPYGFAEQQKAIVWLSAYIEGTPTTEQQADVDAIIQSLSQPELGV